MLGSTTGGAQTGLFVASFALLFQYLYKVKTAITKYKRVVNFWMLLLAFVIIANAVAMIVLMVVRGMETRFVIGFSLSFVGVFLYGFQFLWFGHRIFYWKKVKVNVDLSDVAQKQEAPSYKEKSQIFVSEDGDLIY